MDLSTSFSLFTLEELQKEYSKILTKYHDLKSANDENNQQIYELKRNIQTASAAEAYLSQELELVLSTQSMEIEKCKQNHANEINDLKNKYAQITSLNQSLEQNVDELKTENVFLKHKIDVLEAPKSPRTFISSSSERELQLEEENLELAVKIDQFEEKLNQSTILLAEKECEIEILKEEVQCLKENLQSKREELEEKTSLLESTQERMIEMNAELAALKSQPENQDRKGNSLFAEVDDQRQAMKRLLAAQKKNYLYMKKVYNESEQEIRRLKRENSTIHKEIQACTSIFLSGEKLYKDKLNERILQLLKQNDVLEKRLTWTQEKLIEISNNKGVDWLESMLNFCRNETQELKAQLHSCRMQKGILESNFRNSQQELAKWRFEALRSRCIIIDRENLMEENGIKYPNVTYRDFNISESECQKATPRIVIDHHNKSPKNSNETFVDIKHGQLTEKINTENVENINSTSLKITAAAVNDDSTNKKINEFSWNLLKNNGEYSKIPGNIQKENEMDIADISQSNEIRKKEVERNFSFSIYEDTAQHLPTVKCAVASISEDVSRKLTEIGHASGLSPSEDINSIQAKESMLPPDTNFYQIYLDTTQDLPIAKKCCAKIKDVDENEVEENENKENFNRKLFSNQVEKASATNGGLENIAAIKQNSILVQNRGIFNVEGETKSVRFDANAKDCTISDNKGNIKAFGKQTRTQSNVIIKRVTVKSKSEMK